MASNPCPCDLMVLFSILLNSTWALAAAAPQSGITPLWVIDTTWPRKPDYIKWGQMPGATVDTQDRVYVFNRSEPTVQIYQADGAFLRAWNIEDANGAHGIGPENSVWTTDIKSHVVRKYDPEGKLLLTLGEAGRAGNDERHFDKPTDGAVLSNGEIYVSDGYGNRQVIHFDATGKYVNVS